jgi:hypothetical protein
MRDTGVLTVLMKTIKKWEMPVLKSSSESYLEYVLQNQEYVISGGEGGEKHSVRFEFSNSQMILDIDGIQRIESSNFTYTFGKTQYMIMPPSCSPIIGEEQKTRKWNYCAHHEWISDGALMVNIMYRETGHEQKWLFIFTGDKVNLTISNGCKKLFGLFPDMKSDQNVDFADMIYYGSK